MDFDAERAAAIQLVEQTLIDQGMAAILLTRKIHVTWNDKLIDAIAQAESGGYWLPGDSRLYHEIILSKPIWPILPHRDRYESILHELAHCMTAELHSPRVEGHGPEWRDRMRRMGLAPRECLTTPPCLKAVCLCQTRLLDAESANQVFAKTRNGKGQYRCKICKSIITFEFKFEDKT